MEMPDGKLQNIMHPNRSINEAKWTVKKKREMNIKVVPEAETT